MSLKAQVEALIYVAEEPITLDQLAVLLRDAVLSELAAAREQAALFSPDDVQAGDSPAGPGAQPELDAAWEQELSGLLPQQANHGPAGVPLDPERSPEQDSTREDDEPLFATEATSLSEAEDDEASSPAPQESATVAAPQPVGRKRQTKKSEQEIAQDKAVRTRLREVLAELVADYSSEDRGMEVRPVAGGYRMATKPEHHDLVRAFAKGLKPPIRLSLAALETLAVIAYKQPVTAPEIGEIRGVDSAGVLGTLLDRKLITTAGRKQVIGRPMQYKTSKEFLLRFGLNDVNELPSMEEFSQLAFESAIEEQSGTAPADPATEASSHTSAEPGEAPEAEDAAEE